MCNGFLILSCAQKIGRFSALIYWYKRVTCVAFWCILLYDAEHGWRDRRKRHADVNFFENYIHVEISYELMWSIFHAFCKVSIMRKDKLYFVNPVCGICIMIILWYLIWFYFKQSTMWYGITLYNPTWCPCPCLVRSSTIMIYCKISNIGRTKSLNFNVSRLGLQLSLRNILKPSVGWRMKM